MTSTHLTDLDLAAVHAAITVHLATAAAQRLSALGLTEMTTGDADGPDLRWTLDLTLVPLADGRIGYHLTHDLAVIAPTDEPVTRPTTAPSRDQLTAARRLDRAARRTTAAPSPSPPCAPNSASPAAPRPPCGSASAPPDSSTLARPRSSGRASVARACLPRPAHRTVARSRRYDAPPTPPRAAASTRTSRPSSRRKQPQQRQRADRWTRSTCSCQGAAGTTRVPTDITQAP